MTAGGGDEEIGLEPRSHSGCLNFVGLLGLCCIAMALVIPIVALGLVCNDAIVHGFVFAAGFSFLEVLAFVFGFTVLMDLTGPSVLDRADDRVGFAALIDVVFGSDCDDEKFSSEGAKYTGGSDSCWFLEFLVAGLEIAS